METAPGIAVDPNSSHEADSTFGDDSSETQSVTSTIYRGYVENGRKYQTLRKDKYWGPSDERQLETMEAGHVVYWILDSQEPNQLFRAPIGESPTNIIDIGTGKGTWAIEVADMFPQAVVRGVDLYPPSSPWVPPNCVLEVDDCLEDWTYHAKFDLIHMRLLLGAFTTEEWDKVYRLCYGNLRPGGWIEQIELDVRVASDDDSLPPDSQLAGWGANFLGCAERAGRPLDTQVTMKAAIEKAGFVNVQEKLYKCPIGGWPKDPLLKDAGKVNKFHWSSGLDGWAMWLLTRYGAPEPWSPEEVQVYVAKVRQEMQNPKLHSYHLR